MKVIKMIYYDPGNYLLAAREFMKILLEIYPWANTPLIFKNDEVFTLGIAHLETNLWILLGRSCLRFARQVDYVEWYTYAADCSEALLNMRYVTYDGMAKGFFILHEAHAGQYRDKPRSLMSFGALQHNPAVSSLASLLGHSMAIAANKEGATVWAHKQCYEHDYCNKHQIEAYELFKETLENSLTCKDFLGGKEPLILKTDITVNND